MTGPLPAKGTNRILAEQDLRSLFTVREARRRVFADPTRGLSLTRPNTTVPLPVDTQKIRGLLNSPDPTAALAVALVAFHALTGPQI
ncbi:hypothetical protein [Streptomyces sp. NPDC050704]|uniref:hypothetical protein n=1 Tax=Streptomyces sp. NPDC050704 TaxID=3157219 RepID=UPI00341CDC1E